MDPRPFPKRDGSLILSALCFLSSGSVAGPAAQTLRTAGERV